MRQPIITDATKRQLQGFSGELAALNSQSTGRCNAIEAILMRCVPDTYGASAECRDFMDKHRNNVGSILGNAVMPLTAILPRLPDPQAAGMLKAALGPVERWTTAISDKPDHPQETRQSAMIRTLNELEGFILQNRSRIENDQDWQELMDHIRGLQGDLAAIPGYGEQAKRLLSTITPDGAALATPA